MYYYMYYCNFDWLLFTINTNNPLCISCEHEWI